MVRTLTLATLAGLFLVRPICAGEAPAPPIELTTEAQKVSYILGQDVGNYLKRMQKDLELKVDLAIFMQSINDSLAEAAPRMAEADMTQVKQDLSKRMQAKQAEERKKLEAERAVQGEKNKKEGDAFLAENGKKPGVVTTKSGLQYEVLTEGTGPKPAATDTVSVHYKGTLLDGKEFDSSYSRKEPAKFALNRVVRGWTEGLQLMTVGSKYRLFVPADLGYGPRGKPPQIGPNATLIFEIELLSVEASPEPPMGPPPPPSMRPTPPTPPVPPTPPMPPTPTPPPAK
jgi:FKBP-type peptidyl-prolyl cis-trans isomerase FkpA